MITAYAREGEGLCVLQEGEATAPIWVDLYQPDAGELALMSGRVGVALPTKADQEEIEQSSRLYLEEGVPVMTALLPSRKGSEMMQMGPVTFVLKPGQLITIRHHAPRPFETFPTRAGKASHGCATADAVLVGLLEEIIDRLADLTEQAGREIDAISRRVFGPDKLSTEEHRAALREIGAADTRVMHLRESLMTLERVLGFLMPVLDKMRAAKPLRAMLKTHYRDARTIAEHASYLQQKTALLLDATLGMINIEQNAIIKIFSVAAVVFLPPTLVASIYGMNFTHMPELDWPLGYPLALGIMVLSAAVPLWFFRRRGWL
ncbi:magnesium transporter CorA family protein [Roseovarius autotrophicus]|uniref:magnesium transporter CorA family protein n=1 Tax=Roseovarius autotrophicus TaxID=2824121 RepID=UPI001B35B839|nr:magnesium transporter CorA family protein [Roseovarius autotrophicus]